jgi:hypothetical protein
MTIYLQTCRSPIMSPNNGQVSDERYWEVASRLIAHEAMCEERSKGIYDRLEKIETGVDRINHWGIVIGITLICSMGGLIVTLLLK